MTDREQSDTDDVHTNMDFALDDGFFGNGFSPVPFYLETDSDPTNLDFLPDINLASDTETPPPDPIKTIPTAELKENKMENKEETQENYAIKFNNDYFNQQKMQNEAIFKYQYHLKFKLYEKQVRRMKATRTQSNSSDPGKRRVGDASAATAREIMKKWLVDHWMNPYPNRKQVKNFAQQFNMTEKQIRTFFMNERGRFLERKGCKKDMNFNEQLRILTTNVAQPKLKF